MKTDRSQEFKEKKRIIELETNLQKTKHCFRMEELNFERETAKIVHEQILERGRITRAENRKLYWEKKAAWKD